jgi:hypothetical protein
MEDAGVYTPLDHLQPAGVGAKGSCRLVKVVGYAGDIIRLPQDPSRKEALEGGALGRNQEIGTPSRNDQGMKARGGTQPPGVCHTVGVQQVGLKLSHDAANGDGPSQKPELAQIGLSREVVQNHAIWQRSFGWMVSKQKDLMALSGEEV